MKRLIAPIVEGHGEVEALPVLLRRMLQEQPILSDVEVISPWRLPRSSMLLRPGELEKTSQAMRIKAGPSGLVIAVLDADDDLPCTLGPALLARMRASAGGPVSCVVANREYEAWFLAAATSLAGKRGLPHDLVPPERPEAIRDAKGWLTERFGGVRRYSPTADQAAFSATIDLASSRQRSKSMDKLWRDIESWART